MERRGTRFFEETIRIGRIRSLMDSEGLKRAFEREVIGDTPSLMEEEVGRVIDWIVERNLRVWQDIQGYVARQATRHREGIIGEVGSSSLPPGAPLTNAVSSRRREKFCASMRSPLVSCSLLLEATFPSLVRRLLKVEARGDWTQLPGIVADGIRA